MGSAHRLAVTVDSESPHRESRMSQPLIGLPLFSGTRAVRSWPQLWDQAHAELKRQGYRRNTRRLYRHVLRSVSRHVRVAPAQVREWQGGLTLREAGAVAGGLDYTAVAMAVKRLKQRAETDRCAKASHATNSGTL